VTGTNRVFHIGANGAIGSNSFLTAMEGLSAQTMIGSVTGGFAGIRFGSSGVEIAQIATGVAAVRSAGKAFGLPSVTTGNRASAATVGAGGVCPDSTLNKIIYSDGTNWKDLATGATV
jgi:hypothetical protein